MNMRCQKKRVSAASAVRGSRKKSPAVSPRIPTVTDVESIARRE